MSRGAVDLDKLRVALRRMSRGNLLIVAERAIEIVLRAKLTALVGDMVRLDDFAEGRRGAAPLLDEVRKFHEASLRGEYYDADDAVHRMLATASGSTRGGCTAVIAHRRGRRSSSAAEELRRFGG
jgi:hypothetical protein